MLHELADRSGVLPKVWEETKTSVSLDDSGRRGITIHVSTAKAGSPGAASVITVVSPLLFVTAFRCLDMLWEWYLDQVMPVTPARKLYKDKIRDVKPLDLTTATLPIPLASQRAVAGTLRACYVVLAEARHAVTHRKWGTAVDGDLLFDFVDRRGTHLQQKMSFLEVMKLSSLVGKVAELVIDSSSPRLLDRMILEWLADGLATLTGMTSRGLLPPFKEVISYSVTQQMPPVLVDVDQVLRTVGRPTSGRAIIADLIITGPSSDSETTVWRIPADELEGLSQVRLDFAYDRYRV